MRIALYVHPFDLDALQGDGGLARLRELGVEELAMATSYHAGRWLTPWHPHKRVRFLEDGTVHFRPRDPGVYGELQPLPSSEVQPDGPSPLERLCDDARAADLQVRAWTVFTHNSRLGERHPDACVENAFGDRYPYALCPSDRRVQTYVASMVADLAAHDGLATIELEALGQMGIQHSSHHAKASFSPKGLLDFALSACFCASCRDRFGEERIDADDAQKRVRDLLDRHVRDGDAMAPAAMPGSATDLPDEQRAFVDAVLAVRARTIAELAEQVVRATPTTQRAVQVHPDPWFTGSQLCAASAAVFPSGDERVVTCYGNGPEAIGRLLDHDGCKMLAASPQRLCIWPKAPEFTGDDDVREVARLCVRRGIDSVAVYHLGLLPWATIERVVGLLARPD